jgi:hypothetical protein
MHYLTRPITIRLEPDPALIPAPLSKPLRASTLADRLAVYKGPAFRLRLIPCKRGARLMIGGKAGPVHTTPESLAAALGEHALDAQVALNDAPEGTALYAYRADRLWFYLLAIRAVYNEPKIARLWA